MGSGPRSGIGEILLPELQKGSSIMPGKVNPVLPEVVLQVGAQVIGNDTAITIGGMQGNFELNVRIPLIARNLLQSIHLLSTSSRLFADKCVSGIEANLEGCKRSSESTLAAATALNPYIGYDKGAAIVKEAATSGRMLRDVALEHGVDEATYDEAMDLRKMARGSAPERPRLRCLDAGVVKRLLLTGLRGGHARGRRARASSACARVGLVHRAAAPGDNSTRARRRGRPTDRRFASRCGGARRMLARGRSARLRSCRADDAGRGDPRERISRHSRGRSNPGATAGIRRNHTLRDVSSTRRMATGRHAKRTGRSLIHRQNAVSSRATPTGSS